jgi:pimeloyl-ACP methyl ester carboxylesterase
VTFASSGALAAQSTQVADLGEAQIEYTDAGEGAVVVLLSGRGLAVSYLAPLAEVLNGEGYRTLAINRRGAGASIGSLDMPTYSLHAQDVADLLDALSISEATILGNALGGRVAQAFAADHPDRTTAVILAPAGGAVAGDPEEGKITGRMFRPDATEEDVAAGMALMVGDPATSARVWDEIKASQVSDPATLRAETTLTQPFETWWAPKGVAPFLVIQGALDRQAPPGNAEQLKADLGDRATISVLPGVGHLAVVENPEVVATAIAKFLKQHLSTE